MFVEFPKKFWAQYDENCELCFIFRSLGETLSNSFSVSPREPLKTHFGIDKKTMQLIELHENYTNYRKWSQI